MQVFTENLRADADPGEISIPTDAASGGETRTISVKAGAVGVPNSLEISSRPLGDVDSPIMADDHVLQPGDIVLSRARTVAMHSIITLGQIYKYSWDTENSFRFWSHPAMIVAVAGQPLRNADGTKEGTVMDDVLVQATVNPKGVNFALLKDFKAAYSSRCWIFSPRRFSEQIRSIAVEQAQNEAGIGLFEWLADKGLLEDITTLTNVNRQNGNNRPPPQQFTYGLLSLVSILSSQVFDKWRFRFFNEGQETCSGFIAELMEKANYEFPSEIHAFPADVAEQLYAHLQDHDRMKASKVTEDEKRDAKNWTKGVANLRKQISDDRKVVAKGAGTFRLSSRATKALLSIGAIAAAFGLAISAWLWPHVQEWPWVIRTALAVFCIYAIAVAAPVTYYALRAFFKLAFVGIPQLIRMLRPLYWRRSSDLN